MNCCRREWQRPRPRQRQRRQHKQKCRETHMKKKWGNKNELFKMKPEWIETILLVNEYDRYAHSYTHTAHVPDTQMNGIFVLCFFVEEPDKKWFSWARKRADSMSYRILKIERQQQSQGKKLRRIDQNMVSNCTSKPNYTTIHTLKR